MPDAHGIRRAGPADAAAAGRLLHDFNVEFDAPAPPPEWLAPRVLELLADGRTVVLLAGAGPDGIAVLRFRPALWTDASECHLQELYVVPGRRGHGIGRALGEAVLATARAEGADYVDVATSEDDAVARALYERLGFHNREGGPDGPIAYHYERDI
jgi:ribosomal protein S18 acetylase RimI-like enzyme